MEQKKTDNTEAPKDDKNNLVKAMENMVLYLKLIRGVKGTPLIYVVQCHIKVAHISPGWGACLNLDGEISSELSSLTQS